MNVIKRILALEPVAVQGVLRLLFVLLATVGVTVSDEISGQALAFVAAAYALVEAVTTAWTRSKVSPTKTDPDDTVI